MRTENTIFRRACASVGSQVAMGRILRLSPCMVNQIVSGTRPLPAKYCAVIERETGGQFLAQDLRPDKTWIRVPDANWPHPQGRPIAEDTHVSLVV